MEIRTYTAKIWKAGTGTLVTTVPKTEQEINNIKEGDLIQITYEILKKNHSQKKTKIIDKKNV